MARWSKLGLRAKALVIVTLTALPMLLIFTLLVIALLRQAAGASPARPRGQPAAQSSTRARVISYAFLGGSIVVTIGGFVAAAVLGNNLRRRAMILMGNANRIVSG